LFQAYISDHNKSEANKVNVLGYFIFIHKLVMPKIIHLFYL